MEYVVLDYTYAEESASILEAKLLANRPHQAVIEAQACSLLSYSQTADLQAV